MKLSEWKQTSLGTDLFGVSHSLFMVVGVFLFRKVLYKIDITAINNDVYSSPTTAAYPQCTTEAVLQTRLHVFAFTLRCLPFDSSLTGR